MLILLKTEELQKMKLKKKKELFEQLKTIPDYYHLNTFTTFFYFSDWDNL
jgi:hypothetical protein